MRRKTQRYRLPLLKESATESYQPGPGPDTTVPFSNATGAGASCASWLRFIHPRPLEKSWTASAYPPERHLSARLFPKHLSIILRPPSDLCACGHELYFQDRLFPAFHSIEFVVFGLQRRFRPPALISAGQPAPPARRPRAKRQVCDTDTRPPCLFLFFPSSCTTSY